MQGIATVPLETRLQRRYVMLVQSHLRSAPAMAAGVAALPGAGLSFASTQGAWRFLNNERVTLSALVAPLRQVGVERCQRLDAPFVLLVHDWSKLAFDDHKDDLVQLTHQTDIGYELTTALLVSADDGAPLAPMEMHLRTAGGMLSTRIPAPRVWGHLEQVLPTMRASRGWGLDRPILHVIDREADSVDHYRRWDAANELFLIRADDRRVKWEGKSALLSEIAPTLRKQRKFACGGTAEYQGRTAQLWVAEASVVLHRPAKKNVRGKKYEKPGRPLPLRLVVVQVRNAAGKVLAQWFLLTNAPDSIAAEKLARCYYWRWRIESFFKLLKSHGQQLEHWQQTTGPAIARRLLIAAMACVTVWQLQADPSPRAQQLKTLLIRLSGRQMKRTKPVTAPALLAGLWTLLSILNLLEHDNVRHLRQLAQQLPFQHTG
jgi:Transposase DDE domain